MVYGSFASCYGYRLLEFGISNDDPDVVKGRAGSPYAVKDYYNVDPDLAVDVANRLGEFQDLIERSHNNDLKVPSTLFQIILLVVTKITNRMS